MRRSMLVGLILAGLVPMPVTAQQLDQESLAHGLESTVFIKSERVFRGLYFPGFGSGFFVHPDGYILTNWHVVADQIDTNYSGQQHEIKTKVVRLEVVIDSGSPNERVVPAKVVARDREMDLALLHVQFRPKAWMEIVQPPEPSLAQPIWLIGYPLGNLLSTITIDGASSPEEIPNPSVSINRGMVTSMRRDPSGKLAALQIDAAVNPGNSGGPLIDQEGRVIGVVTSKIMGAEGLGFAISPNLLEDFARSKSAKVSFKPSRVQRTPVKPIQVSVEPVLASLGEARGTVRIHADGLDPIEIELEKSGPRWTGEITLPELGADDEKPEFYYVDLDFAETGDTSGFHRKFRLNAADADLRVASQRQPDAMLKDRKTFSNEMAISDYTRSGAVSGSDTRSLSDVAKNVKLKRSESGSIVIDDHSLAQLTSPLERNFPAERYDQLGNAQHRGLARDYDLGVWIQRELESRMRLVEQYLDDPDYRVRSAAKEAAHEYRSLKPKVDGEVLVLRQRVREANFVFCYEEEKWYYSHSAPCEAPEYP